VDNGNEDLETNHLILGSSEMITHTTHAQPEPPQLKLTPPSLFLPSDDDAVRPSLHFTGSEFAKLQKAWESSHAVVAVITFDFQWGKAIQD